MISASAIRALRKRWKSMAPLLDERSTDEVIKVPRVVYTPAGRVVEWGPARYNTIYRVLTTIFEIFKSSMPIGKSTKEASIWTGMLSLNTSAKSANSEATGSPSRLLPPWRRSRAERQAIVDREITVSEHLKQKELTREIQSFAMSPKGYISWNDYERNQEIISSNANMKYSAYAVSSMMASRSSVV